MSCIQIGSQSASLKSFKVKEEAQSTSLKVFKIKEEPIRYNSPKWINLERYFQTCVAIFEWVINRWDINWHYYFVACVILGLLKLK